MNGTTPISGTGPSDQVGTDEHSLRGVRPLESSGNGTEEPAGLQRTASLAELRAYLELLWPEASLYHQPKEK